MLSRHRSNGITMPSNQSFDASYPWSWLNDPRDIVILTASGTVPTQSTISGAPGPTFVNPPYARVTVKFRLNGNEAFTPPIAMTVSPFLLPIPNEVRNQFELEILPEPGVTITRGDFQSNDFDNAPFT